MGPVSFFQSTAIYFPVHIHGCVIDIEAVVIVILCAVGFVVEVIWPAIILQVVSTGHMQHGTMYFFYGMAGLSALVLPQFKVITYCDQITYLMLFMSYLVEGMLFEFHITGRDDLDINMHTLLVYTIFASAAVTLLEMKHRSSIWPPLVRGFLTCLQGSWFWQIAFLLYPPSTNPWGPEPELNIKDREGSLMFIASVYTWHMAIITILMIVCSVCIGCFYRKKGWLDEEAMVNNQFSCRKRSLGYTSLKQSRLEINDESYCEREHLNP